MTQLPFAPRSGAVTVQAESHAVRVTTYVEIANLAVAVRAHYAQIGVRLHRDSALGALLRKAERTANEWSKGQAHSIREVIDIGHAMRFAEAILAVRADLASRECLRRIASKGFDLSNRSSSQGKDALWELELLDFFRRRGISARLIDPPDLFIDLGTGDYPIACKKVYSEKGVKAQLRKGIQQLRPFGAGSGIVAFNLDDLVPEDVVLRSRTLEEASEHLHEFNEQFIARHRLELQRPIVEGKCDGIMLATSVFTEIEMNAPKFNNHTQTALWSLSSASPAVKARLDCIRTAIGGTSQGSRLETFSIPPR